MILVGTAVASSSLIGPVSSTDRAVATWNGSGGTNLRSNASVLIDASGNLSLGAADLLFTASKNIGALTGTLSGTDYRPRNIFSSNCLIVGNPLGNNPPYGLNSAAATFKGFIVTGHDSVANSAVFIASTTTFNSVAQSLIGFGKDGAFANLPAFINSNTLSDNDVYFSLLHLNSTKNDLLKFGGDGAVEFLKAGSETYRIFPASAVVTTTDATVTTVQTVPTVSDTNLFFSTKLVGRRTGGAAGSAGDSACIKKTAIVKNIGGTVTVNNPQTDYQAKDQAAWGITLTVSGTNVLVQANGDVDNNISWTATTETQRV